MLAVSMLMPARALAEATLGSTLSHPDMNQGGVCQSPCTFFNTALPGAQLTASGNGTIVAWRVRNLTQDTYQLRILRPEGGGQLLAVSSSAPETTTGGDQISQFATDQPVQAGDLIALETTTGGEAPITVTSGATGSCFGDGVSSTSPEIADGQTGTPTPCSTNEEYQFNADFVGGSLPTVTTLNAVSCPAAGACLAVGTTTLAPATTQGALAPITGSTLGSVSAIPGAAALNGLACTSATTCLAVGMRLVSDTPQGILIPIIGGIPGAVQPVPGTTELNGIACGTTACLAVGQTSGAYGAIVRVSKGTAGAVQTVPTADALLGIACPSASTCLAAGNAGRSGVIVPIVKGTAGSGQTVPGALSLGAVACPTAGTCEAVGTATGNPPQGVVVPITATTANPAQPLSSSAGLSAIACPTTPTSPTPACLAAGQTPGGAASVVNIAGSLQTAAQAASLNAIACYPGGQCEAVGQATDLTNPVAVPVAPTADPSPNNQVTCSSSLTGGGGFDAVVDQFSSQQVQSGETYGGVRATISAAAVCRDPASNPPTSSWVMLQDSGNSGFVQAGIFYNPDGTDNPFVEIQYPGFQPPQCGYNDGLITACVAIEFFGLGQASSGTFAVLDKGLTTKQVPPCPWIVKAGKRQTYSQFAGDLPSASKPTDEVETTLNGNCLWIYYLPAQYASQGSTPLVAADLTGGETHTAISQVPGTYEQPLTFTGAKVFYPMSGGAWRNFVSNGSGNRLNPPLSMAPSQAYTGANPSLGHSVGCQRYMPYSGSAYTFSTWAANSQRDITDGFAGLCAPWSVFP